jgi:hypothetical protein
MAYQEDIALMAHLMRRAGFGAGRDELGARVAKGYEATVEELLHPETQPAVDSTRCSANPDMMKARRRVRSLEPEYRFCFPTAVDFDPETDRIIVADSQRNRLQIYREVRDYVDFQANL